MRNERIAWAQRMVKLGYMSQAQLELEIRKAELNRAADFLQWQRDRDRAAGPAPKADPDVQNLQGKWKIDWIWVNKGDAQSSFIVPGAQTSLTNKDDARSSLTAPGTATPLEFTGNTLLMPYLDASTGIKTVRYTFTVDSSKSPKEIDLFANGKLVGKGIYQFDRATGLRIAVSQDGKRPGMIEQRGRDGVITFELTRPDPKGNVTALEMLDHQGQRDAALEAERQRAAVETFRAQAAARVAQMEADVAKNSVLVAKI
jgi:uncharacterized protein (TIGR03067 family)